MNRAARILHPKLLLSLFFLVGAIHPEAPWFYLWRAVNLIVSIICFNEWRKSVRKPADQ